MKTILEHIKDLPRSEWDYYYDINKLNELQNPFLDNNIPHADFIFQYFKRGGKVQVFDTIGNDFSEIRYPNHINSVFFIGLLIYYNTLLSDKTYRSLIFSIFYKHSRSFILDQLVFKCPFENSIRKKIKFSI